jgi:fungal STAND N-terminal Goodbye domain
LRLPSIPDPNPRSPSLTLNPHSIPSETKYCERLVASMSSTGKATSSTSSTSNIQLITDALADYAKITGIDLSRNPFAAAIERADSPGAILELLKEREKAFRDYREGNRTLISCLTPAVNVIQSFSGILGEVVSLVSHTCHLVSSFNVNSSGPLPTNKRIVRWDRCPPLCSSLS